MVQIREGNTYIHTRVGNLEHMSVVEDMSFLLNVFAYEDAFEFAHQISVSARKYMYDIAKRKRKKQLHAESDNSTRQKTVCLQSQLNTYAARA